MLLDITYNLNILQVVVITALTWHYALRCGFISDDHAVIEGRKDIIPDTEKNPAKEKYWVKVFNDGIVVYYINAVMSKIGGRHLPILWHILSLGLHLSNTCLLYYVLTPIFGEQVAICATLFWAINPMLNQNTVWISGRPYVIATTLALVAFLYHALPIMVIPLYFLAVVTNISVLFLPVLIKMIWPEAWQSNLYLIVMVAVGLPFILWKFKKRFTAALVIDRENFRISRRRVFTIVKVYLYYMWAILVPIKMGWYHQAGFGFNPKWEKFNIWTLLGFIGMGCMISSGVPGWWWILGILPNSNIFATNSFLQDRYLYFGSIGLAIILAPIFVSYPLVFIIAVTFYGVRSYMYSRHLIDDERMYRENWRNHPRSDHAINNLAFFLIQQKRYDEAKVVVHQGLEISKSNKMLWYNLGIAWACQGNLSNDEGKFRFIKAIDCWKQALSVEPRWKKPAEDIKRMVDFLIKNNVLSLEKDDSKPHGLTIQVPLMGGK